MKTKNKLRDQMMY